jgi:hypothetical protein
VGLLGKAMELYAFAVVPWVYRETFVKYPFVSVVFFMTTLVVQNLLLYPISDF